jgi:hypothetical protein
LQQQQDSSHPAPKAWIHGDLRGNQKMASQVVFRSGTFHKKLDYKLLMQ